MFSLEDIKSIEYRYQSYYEPDSLPSFLIDYLSTKKAIIAARNVLQFLQNNHIIANASKSISLDRSQRLFPDLILFNHEKYKYIIIEIKRSSKTARETITEIIAYESELKNTLPFLSNYEVNFCIISTEYPDLLDHSISGLINWESQQILCLKLDEQDLNLRIHIPSVWTSTGNITFPPNAISTFHIILYQHSDENTLADAESAIFYAASIIAREGDRNNSHGFALMWHDCWDGWENVGGATKFHLMIGFVNPYVFLPFAQKVGMIDASQSPIGEYLIENSENMYSTYFSSDKVVEKGISYLRKNFSVSIEGLSSWDTERKKYYDINSTMSTMRHRSLPLRIELWGSLGDFAREFISHPGVNHYILSGMSNRMISCEDPFIAIPILDAISGINQLNSKGFTCKVLFDLGVSLGTLLTLYNTAIGNQNVGIKQLPASITWYMLDIQAILLEISIRYKESNNITVAPPAINIRIKDKFEEGLSSIESFMDWMYSHFLGDTNEIHSICFELGLKCHAILDSHLDSMLPDDYRKDIEENIYATSNYLLKNISYTCSLAKNLYLSDQEIMDIINDLSKNYLEEDFNKMTLEEIFALIDNIPRNKHLTHYHTKLMNLLDRLIPPVTHDNQPLSTNIAEYKHIDWIWIREKLLYLRDKGVKFPAVEVKINGVINIVDCSEEMDMNPIKNNIDFTNNFPFILSYPGMKQVLIKKWKELDLSN